MCYGFSLATHNYITFEAVLDIAKVYFLRYGGIMLTKDDLREIRGIVKDEIKTEIDPLKKDVKELKGDVKTLRTDVSKIRKGMDTIVSSFDREYLELRERVENIEHHLGIASSS